MVVARTGVRRELAARVDMNVLRWFGHVERVVHLHTAHDFFSLFPVQKDIFTFMGSLPN